jgi:ankyrin repeat protein
MLEELPETLDETYERILRDINKANRAHTHRLLQCLTVAVRPLRVAELAEVLAIDFRTASHGVTSKLNTDWRWDDQQQAVLSTCSSLISVVDEEDSQVVQFSHFSVKEFLTSSRLARSSPDVSRFHILLEPAHTILAKACLGVLLRLDEHMDGGDPEDSFPLARYAAEHWVHHAQFEQVSSYLREEMEDLFDPVKPCFAAWVRVHDMDFEPRWGSSLYLFASVLTPEGPRVPLYYAALCGFHDLAEHLIIKHPQQVNASSGYFLSPLGAALGREHLDVAQLLYQHGASVDVHGFNGWTPLFAASKWGHREMVEWLLGHGADPNHRSDNNIWTSLHVTAAHGQVEVSRILLQHQVDPNAPDKYDRTPLHLASERGYIDIARLLLERGVDGNAQNDNHSTALHLASEKGHIDIARLLLEHGVDVNVQDSNRSTPLHRASGNGILEVACLLLEHGADVDVEDDMGMTPSQVASGRRCDEITKLFSEESERRILKSTNTS